MASSMMEKSSRVNPFNFLEEDGFSYGRSDEMIAAEKACENGAHAGTSYDSSESEDVKTEGVDPDNEGNIELISSAEFQRGFEEDHFSDPMKKHEECDLESLSARLKQQVIDCTDQQQKQELVQQLVNVRMQLAGLQETSSTGSVNSTSTEETTRHVLGHTLVSDPSTSIKRYCEKCSGVIVGLLHEWLRCSACGYYCHQKCLNQITRQCAAVKASELTIYQLSICPERGLASQGFACAECRRPLSYKPGVSEPRQCDYNGSYYCELCHWNDVLPIPARIIHNWDFTPRKVCRASKQLLKLMFNRPLVDMEQLNPTLFTLVEELDQVKKLREQIMIMKTYFLSCPKALQEKLLLKLEHRQHFVDGSRMFSIQDLQDIDRDRLLPSLLRVHAAFAQHIKHDCETCKERGATCELCISTEVLFPFDSIAVTCSQCSTPMHRHCLKRRGNHCPRCERSNSAGASSEQPVN